MSVGENCTPMVKLDETLSHEAAISDITAAANSMFAAIAATSSSGWPARSS